MVITSRTQEKGDAAAAAIVALNALYSGRLHVVVGDFASKEQATVTAAAVIAKTGSIDHVLSNLGFVQMINKTIVDTTAEELVDNLTKNGVFALTYAYGTFIGHLKGREGATFAHTSGGFAHGVFFPTAWAGTFRNASINSMGMVLQADSKNFQGDKVKVYTVCIHFGVADFGCEKNQMGMESVDTRKFGPFFAALAASQRSSEQICLDKVETAQAFFE